MDQALESMLPLFAPLPGPLVLHLLLGKRRSHRKAPPPPLLTPFEQATGSAQAEWNLLLQQVRVARQDVFLRMDPLVSTDALTTSWFLQALLDAFPQRASVLQEEIAQSTLGEWRKRGLISNAARNRPDPHQAAALLIARLVDTRLRNWLPSTLTPEEARAWCWRQDAPHLVPVPYQLPIPDDLPKATLLVSAWPGLAWSGTWMRINSMGAARWAGGIVSDGQLRWDLSLEDLHRWDQQVTAFNIPLVEGAADLLQRLADIALIRLALAQLGAQG